ncbi:MAG: NAD-dependent epimerase/dehydratase family protein [Calothrix sp. FI2-JRJ7]|jgi:nucleoside-diphosphate-sugar epimerase|nr:NAD-dependent epimerase/dehydratase family protein [Calothrix sp. FI2-JRJ7]
MKILIIGGTNFIGPPVISHLTQMGHEVTIFHRGKTNPQLPAGVNEIIGERKNIIQIKDKLQQLSPEVVLDMIAYTEHDVRALSEALQGVQARLVVVSSIDVYQAYDVLLGKESNVVPVPLTEDSPLRTSLYPFREMQNKPLQAPDDYEKILVEKAVMSNPDLPGTVIRLPMVYGENDPLHRLFPYLERIDDNRAAIVLPESLANWRGSYGYVENIAYAIALAVTNARATNRIYHVADIENKNEAERITQVGKIAQWQGKVVTISENQLPPQWKLPLNVKQDWLVDSTRIRQELGYKEIVSSDEALWRTINWQRANVLQQPTQFAAPYLLDYAVENEILAKCFSA